MPSKPSIHVAIGILQNSRGEVLLARRPEGTHLEGYWEFPGGKLEPGESVNQALLRELDEEVGIQPGNGFPFMRKFHDYPDRQVVLHTWLFPFVKQQGRGREGQELRWFSPADIQSLRTPPANNAIVDAICRPRQIAITSPSNTLAEFKDQLQGFEARGVRLVYIRQKQLKVDVLSAWVADALASSSLDALRFLASGLDTELQATGRVGEHLSTAKLMETRHRPVTSGVLLSAACHNLEQLQRAEQLEADLVFLSPVLATDSKPGRAAMGWQAFGKLAAQAYVPVYALGGLSERDLPQARQQGAVGIAGIRCFQH